MIISKFGKSYDTADGSEQHHAAPPQSDASHEQLAPIGLQDKGTSAADAPSEKRENDGGALLVSLHRLQIRQQRPEVVDAEVVH
jgi:hypothetical protein